MDISDSQPRCRSGRDLVGTLDPAAVQTMLDTHVLGLIKLTQDVLPDMCKRNVGSPAEHRILGVQYIVLPRLQLRVRSELEDKFMGNNSFEAVEPVDLTVHAFATRETNVTPEAVIVPTYRSH
ncbi:uncharacterized protein OGAPODRAFT_9577 [Ogataea polymorpha]|uniref:uncharacterized protein n=1 Tax=Ogataea polymorpha TaxID=460523 RepID=UPI0007F43764|nr:uncharacterized protein OGAPODRAFT_9577 [Ogataea polymorpha]OBA15331.1 hypothetical protein OGAPODRAFT_9577 [Ogataea polymorpha]